MTRPSLVAVEGEGESVEELERSCARELCDVTERWVAQLPATSAWRRTCAGLNAACAAFLGARSLRRIRP